MRQLLAIAYEDVIQAEQTRLKILQMQREFLLELEDIVIAVKQPDGKVKLNQAINLTAAGAAQGSFLGMLVGLIFLNPLLGVAIGAASGAVMGALGDVGIEDDMMREMASGLNQGGVILFVLAHDLTVDRVISALDGAGGKVLKSSLRHADEQALQQALNSGNRTGELIQTGPVPGASDAIPHQQTVPEAKDAWRDEGNPN